MDLFTDIESEYLDQYEQLVGATDELEDQFDQGVEAELQAFALGTIPRQILVEKGDYETEDDIPDELVDELRDFYCGVIGRIL